MLHTPTGAPSPALLPLGAAPALAATEPGSGARSGATSPLGMLVDQALPTQDDHSLAPFTLDPPDLSLFLASLTSPAPSATQPATPALRALRPKPSSPTVVPGNRKRTASELASSPTESLTHNDSSGADQPAESSVPPTKRARKALTPEERLQKRKERTQRNRDAAQQSRERKKQHLANLESRNEQLEDENAALRQRMAEMEQQNAALLAQVAALTQQLQLPASPASVAELSASDNVCSPELAPSSDSTGVTDVTTNDPENAQGNGFGKSAVLVKSGTSLVPDSRQQKPLPLNSQARWTSASQTSTGPRWTNTISTPFSSCCTAPSSPLRPTLLTHRQSLVTTNILSLLWNFRLFLAFFLPRLLKQVPKRTFHSFPISTVISFCSLRLVAMGMVSATMLGLAHRFECWDQWRAKGVLPRLDQPLAWQPLSSSPFSLTSPVSPECRQLVQRLYRSSSFRSNLQQLMALFAPAPSAAPPNVKGNGGGDGDWMANTHRFYKADAAYLRAKPYPNHL
ncbi:hypothetical protein H4R35_006517 [Dimargaris xerosporica]|nr:hypothetical protein H4R35_006517 [Dimargaris xerosporica]